MTCNSCKKEHDEGFACIDRKIKERRFNEMSDEELTSRVIGCHGGLEVAFDRWIMLKMMRSLECLNFQLDTLTQRIT